MSSNDKVGKEPAPISINIRDLLWYDYCPHYYHIRKQQTTKVGYDAIADPVIHTVMNRYWIERAAEASPNYKVLERSIDNIFLRSGFNPDRNIKDYLQKVMTASGRIRSERTMIVDQIFPIKTAYRNITVHIVPTVIFKAQGKYKSVSYPINSQNLAQKSPPDRFARLSTVGNIPFLIEEYPITTSLLVYPDRVVELKRRDVHNKMISRKIDYLVDGIVNKIDFNRIGAWCNHCNVSSIDCGAIGEA